MTRELIKEYNENPSVSAYTKLQKQLEMYKSYDADDTLDGLVCEVRELDESLANRIEEQLVKFGEAVFNQGFAEAEKQYESDDNE